MIANFVANRDIYATLYELATGSPYEENLETKDGEFYPEGKKRRGVGKILQLALTYGMGVQAVADIIKLPLEEAEEVVTAFKDNLPGVTAFETKLKEFARKNGFVPTMYGTRCRFPNYALEPLEVKSQDGSKLDASLVASIKDQINKVWSFNDKKSLRKELEVQYNVKIKDNSGYIKEDETKILNGVIQGTASNQTKRAMILLDECEELKAIDGYIELSVHDELVVSVPEEHSQKGEELLAKHMIAAAQEKVTSFPFYVDTEVMYRWGEQIK